VRRLAYHAPALLLFCALTLLLAYPIVAIALAGGVPGWEGDNCYYVRSLWWMKRALLELHISPFVDPTAYYPVGHSIARSEMSVANTIPAVPITLLAGPVVAYDVVLLFSFVATALGTYLWVERLTGRRAAGLLAGTIVAFVPFRFAHLSGHLPQLTTQWIPMALHAFERFLEERTLRRAGWLGVTVALVALGCWYYAYSLGLLLPLYVLVRTWRGGVWRERSWWQGLALSSGVAGALVFPFLVPMLKLAGSGALDRPLEQLQFWALNYYDFFIPNLGHPLWGDAAAAWFPRQRTFWTENGQSLGYVAIGLALVGIRQWRRRRPSLIAALAAVWIASYAVALGPFLIAGDQLVRVPVPEALGRTIADLLPESQQTQVRRESILQEGVPIPLPSFLLFEFVPFTSGMRVMARFGFWTALMTAALSGFGLVSLLSAGERRFGRRATWLIPGALVALVAAESASRVPTLRLQPRAVDLWLARQPNDVVIVELPLTQGRRSLQNYWATQHGRRSLLGWGAAFPSPLQKQRREALLPFPERSAIEFLQASAATHVLMTPAQVPDWGAMERAVRAAPGLQFVQAFDGVLVYRVVRQPLPD